MNEIPSVDVCKCGRVKDSIWHYFTDEPGPNDLGAHRFQFSHRAPEWREAALRSSALVEETRQDENDLGGDVARGGR